MNRLFAVTLRLSEVASPQCQTAKEAPIPQEIVDKKEKCFQLRAFPEKQNKPQIFQIFAVLEDCGRSLNILKIYMDN
jgi:hypothetical protein